MAEQTKQFPQKPDHRDGWTRRLVAGFLTLASLTTCSAAVAAGQAHISSAAVQSADVSSDERADRRNTSRNVGGFLYRTSAERSVTRILR